MVVITVAPEERAILLKSALSTLRTPITPASMRYFWAKSSIPSDVRIRVAPDLRILATRSLRIEISLAILTQNSTSLLISDLGQSLWIINLYLDPHSAPKFIEIKINACYLNILQSNWHLLRSS